MANLNSITQDPLLKRFFLWSIVFFILLGGAIGGAWYGFEEMNKELAIQKAPKVKKLNELQSQVKFLQKQLKLYEQYGAKYEELIAKGLVKKQDRVFWTDKLIGFKQTLVMPEFTFNFMPEKPLTSGLFQKLKVPNKLFYFSRIKFTMNMQHEEDVLRLMELLNAKVSPIYLLESCELNLKDEDHKVQANFNLTEGNVSAVCTIVAFHTHIVIGQGSEK
ncbi:hypothetical protein [Thiomicrorhabdus indica]|uniref:hypothetical protein n=1 Tax=Thiomicrorhabdus indica TaxID=2267253 RepID=UPI00102E09C6|nr:hypothetical protein [Thiomicrorhabdus indica]